MSEAGKPRPSGWGAVTEVTVILPWPPGANHLWRSGKGRVYRSGPYMAWLKEASWVVKAGKFEQILGEFSATIVLNPPDKRRIDLDGRIKAVLDVAQSTGLIENDYLCRRLVVSYGSSGNPASVSFAPKSINIYI